METKKLKDWFEEIIVGETLVRKVSRARMEKDVIPVLSPSSIRDGIIIDNKIEYYVQDEDPIIKQPICANKYTQENDVILKLIEPYSAVLIDKKHVGLVVPSFCIILRGCDVIEAIRDIYNKDVVYQRIDHEQYIQAFLNSPLFLQKVSMSMDKRSMAKKTLSKTIVENIEVPVFSRRGRMRVIDAYDKLSKNQRYVNRLIELQKEYFLTVFEQASNDNLSDMFEDEMVDWSE